MGKETRKQVLIVEEHPLFRKAVAKALMENCPDIRIVIAETREEALSRIGSMEGLSFVVTDLPTSVPVAKGEAIARAAQEKGIGVIVFSVHVNNLSEDVRRGCLGVLDKTISEPADLASVINQHFAAVLAA